ncbi:hypothetical protein E6O75_ATG03822 [Venturia nashicola]|uniref:Uncharacterized protein n=1 Tax=Venturia nashicola TaxID=86259 RepID=A0A4Z1PEN3_9PEZI|nr:hypothetical protein E6O75_ATG03822 [Venturia nashicola]
MLRETLPLTHDTTIEEATESTAVYRYDPINGIKIFQDVWDSYTGYDEEGNPTADIDALTDQCLEGDGTLMENKLLGATGITIFPPYLDRMKGWANSLSNFAAVLSLFRLRLTRHCEEYEKMDEDERRGS